MARDGGRRHPAAQAQHEDRAGRRVREQRQVSRQNLRRHVHHRPGVDLAVDAEKRVRPLAGDGDRAAPAVTIEEDGFLGHDLPEVASLPRREIVLGVDRGTARHHARVPGGGEGDARRGRERDGGRHEAACAPPRPRQERGGNEEARDDGGLERGMHPPAGNQHETAQDDAHDGPHGVRGVEPSDLPPDSPAVHRHRCERARKGRADAERGGQERRRAQQELEERDPARRHRPSEAREQKIRQALEAQQREGRERSDAQLDRAEGRGAGRARAPPPGVDCAAGGDTDQHDHEHGRERIGRAADDERERPRPRDLEDHGRGARDRHGGRNQPRTAPGIL